VSLYSRIAGEGESRQRSDVSGSAGAPPGEGRSPGAPIPGAPAKTRMAARNRPNCWRDAAMPAPAWV